MVQRLARRDVLALGAASSLAAGLPGAGSALAEDSAPLLKSISLIVRKLGTTVDQFKARWLGEHGPGARAIPGVQGFVLGEVVADPARAGSAAVESVALDGVAASWQAPGIDRQAQARTDPHVREWLAAAPSYIGNINIFVTREHVFVPPRRGGLKIMTLISRKPDMTHEAFVRHVLDVHGPLSRNVPGLGGYVMSEILRSSSMPGLPPVPGLGEIDIIGESWLPEDPAQRTPDTPERRAWLADGAASFGSFRRYAMVEHIFVPPPA
jgi:hypothetical protein